MDLHDFVPLDVADKEKKKGGGKKGALTMICSKKNGKRLLLSAEVVETLDLGDERIVRMGFKGKKLVMSKKLPGESNYFSLKKSGKKFAIYSAEAVNEISRVQQLLFDDRVSFTWYEPEVDELDGVPVVLFAPEGRNED
ncbi:hypothetical protein FND36_15925 [Lachnospiraceae bacterium KGMB03038]|nr:hypothetical protein FND36_15925 [Lachnospiraceae bacterium KGMB03038]